MAALWSSRPGWLCKLGILLLIAWLLILFFSASHVLRNKSSLDEEALVSKEHAQRLTQLSNQFESIKKQSEALRNIILGEGENEQNDQVSIQDKLQSASLYLEQNDYQRPGVPSLEYEQVRRRIRNNIQELWYYISSELGKYQKQLEDYEKDQKGRGVSESLKNLKEYKKTLLKDMEQLKLIDGYNDWREKESALLSDLVQRRFRYLQNPADCSKAKKLICSLNKGCGFGCQIHHVVYCFLVAYGTERTLILKSKGWRYHKDGWDSVFEPVSDTCTSTQGESHANWPGDSNTQVLSLPIVDKVNPMPKYQPPSVPADIALRLEKIHGYPIVWWVGQVLKYLMRPQDHLKKVIEYSKEKLNFQKPIVGIHVRRTDKIGTEAAYHDIDEYMAKVEQYFDELVDKPEVRRVFIASDDPKVITNAKKRYYPKYEIIGDPSVAETASVSRRYSDASLQGIILDIYMLSMCDYLVCTFSSQVCRVAYEMMQTHYVDASNRFASLDDSYYYGGQNPHAQVAIMDHKPKRPEEIELKVGDPVEVLGNHWNGYSKGRNTRISKTGLFPSFKVRNPVESVEFPRYPNVPLRVNA